MDATTYATCIDEQAVARNRVKHYWSPTRVAEMTGRTLRHWPHSPTFRREFVIAWQERTELEALADA